MYVKETSDTGATLSGYLGHAVARNRSDAHPKVGAYEDVQNPSQGEGALVGAEQECHLYSICTSTSMDGFDVTLMTFKKAKQTSRLNLLLLWELQPVGITPSLTCNAGTSSKVIDVTFKDALSVMSTNYGDVRRSISNSALRFPCFSLSSTTISMQRSTIIDARTPPKSE